MMKQGWGKKEGKDQVPGLALGDGSVIYIWVKGFLSVLLLST